MGEHITSGCGKVDTLSSKNEYEETLAQLKAMQSQIEKIIELERENKRLAKETEDLRAARDEERKWAGIPLMEILNPGLHFSEWALERNALRNGCEVKVVFDSALGNVRVFPSVVWEAVYGEQLDNTPWLREWEV